MKACPWWLCDHLTDALLSAAVSLAALVACVGVLYLFAPVEWP